MKLSILYLTYTNEGIRPLFNLYQRSYASYA